ncbi:restriction endonuclease subunit S [Micromonospora sp. DT46]|uniref:restriction endonuclease subunit S n=1 Tax=unclassified Micromonospora TaxID=2617518 RepID=UPI002E15616D|nr:restriction endonuclease subunit S [Micromonospora sp. NBC_01740]
MPLRRFINEIVDGPFGSSLTSSHYSDEGARVVRLGNIGSAYFRNTDAAYIPLDYYTHLQRHTVIPGDLLIAGLGDERHPVGRGCIAPDNIGPAIVKADCFRARLDEKRLTHRFAAWALSSSFVTDQVIALTRGSTRSRINLDVARDIRLPIPPPLEQHRIADFLDAETAHIDRLAADRMRQRAILEERSYAEVSETLIPGVLTAGRGTSPWPWLPNMPEDVPLVRLGYVCRLQNGLTVDGNRDVSGDAVTRPYLRVANVQAGYVDLANVTEVTVPRETAKRCTLRTGDVLMTEGGDLDKLGRGTVWNGELPNCLHQNHVFALRPELDRLDGDYLALMTQTMHGRCYFESTGSRTTNLASTNSSKILSFPIPLPRVIRQRELVRSVRNRLDAIARLRRELDQQLALLTERRQALITAAVTGQIDISTASGRGIEA